MKKELPHFKIGSSYGGNQEWFDGFMMRIGGCAAECACDLCIYMDLYKNTRLYPFDKNNLTKEDYISFGSVMKPYLHPRMSGIDKLSIFIDGFGEYLNNKDSNLKLSGVEGNESFEKAKNAVVNQIDRGIPVPFLCLHHSQPCFKDYEWHWFLLNGYEFFENTVMVKAVTYSEFEWLDFNALWDSGYQNKGGLIVIEQ